MSILHPLAAKHKSPRVWVATITWMTTAAADFGPLGLDKKAAIGYCKEMLTNTNAGVREAGTEFAALLHSQARSPSAFRTSTQTIHLTSSTVLHWEVQCAPDTLHGFVDRESSRGRSGEEPQASYDDHGARAIQKGSAGRVWHDPKAPPTSCCWWCSEWRTCSTIRPCRCKRCGHDPPSQAIAIYLNMPGHNYVYHVHYDA